MTANRTDQIPRVGIIGGFQYGKSTLINCLTQDRVAVSGSGLSTTKQVTRYFFSSYPVLNAFSKNDEKSPCISIRNITTWELERIIKNNDIVRCEIGVPCGLLKHVELWDTPGLDADDRDSDVAFSVLSRLDYTFIMISGFLSQSDVTTLHRVSNEKVPYTVLYNSKEVERWDPSSEENKYIRDNSTERIRQLGFDSSIFIPGCKGIFPINTAWYWYEFVRRYRDKHFLLSSSSGEIMLFKEVQNYLAFHQGVVKRNLMRASNVDMLRDFLMPEGIIFGNLPTQLLIYRDLFCFQKFCKDKFSKESFSEKSRTPFIY